MDVLAGQNLTTGILAALYHRARTGRGQRVDVNLLSSLLSSLVNQASAYLNAGVVPGRLGNTHPSIAPYQTVPTADATVALAVGNDSQFRRLATVLSDASARPDLGADPRFTTNTDRVRHAGALADELAERMRGRTAADWVRRLTAAGVPCGPVNTVAEAFALADELGLDPVVRIPTEDGSAASVATPVSLSATPASYRLPPPWHVVSRRVSDRARRDRGQRVGGARSRRWPG